MKKKRLSKEGTKSTKLLLDMTLIFPFVYFVRVAVSGNNRISTLSLHGS
jgi:hypothetical protein